MSDSLASRAARALASPAGWCALVLAGVPVALELAGWLGAAAYPLAALGAAAGYALGGMAFGFPRLDARAREAQLAFADTGDPREAIEAALAGIRALVADNPDGRLGAALQAAIRDVCARLEGLLAQWEDTRGELSLEEEFHARHIALSYLPEALRGYLAIPQEFAATKRLENGRTAEETFAATLAELAAKVDQLRDDLAGQDAQAFLSHSRVVLRRFAQAQADGQD
jgi:hypothetical protein